MGETVEYRVIKSNRKTISIQIQPDASVLVRAPLLMRDFQIREFVEKKKNWILTHQKMAAQRKEQENGKSVERMSETQLRKLAKEALEYIPKRAEYFAKKMQITYGRITIRNQKTRWGSCSSKGNLNFNCLLMLAPPDVLDYVVIHELCHRKEMNHSERFWKLVEAEMPDYKEKKKWLKEHGNELIQRM